MIVDAAGGGALMNKDFTIAYALIEDMTQNHYQWINEKTKTVSSPSKQEACMNEISHLDHLSAKVDALSEKFDKMNISAITPTSILPSCGACSISGHTSIEC
jgi:ubiquinone biosynthesis protein UbiJ